MSKLQQLFDEFGQSIWMDFISREVLAEGTLADLVDKGLRGVTSNPSIFDKAISSSDAYDETIARLKAEGASTFEIYDEISRTEVTAAADVLRPVYEASKGTDGLVSLEVNPDLAYDTEATIAEARRLWQAVDRPNLMIKVPSTAEGIPAMRQLIGEGLNINATLMFSLEDYENVSFAYLDGLERLLAGGGDISRSASVASFFVSRIDVKVDKQLAAAGNEDLQGKIAIANARLAYQRFLEVFGSERWQALAERGAHVQRPLWASTSTKNPSYSDVLYVENLIGPHTVNTLPLDTIEALIDHAELARTVDEGVEEARAMLARLPEVGVDYDQVTAELQEEGVKAFADSFHSLLDTIEEQAQKAEPAAA